MPPLRSTLRTLALPLLLAPLSLAHAQESLTGLQFVQRAPVMLFQPVVAWCSQAVPARESALQQAWSRFQERLHEAAAPLLARTDLAQAMQTPMPPAQRESWAQEVDATGRHLQQEMEKTFGAEVFCDQLAERLDAREVDELREMIEGAYTEFTAKAAARAAPGQTAP